MSVGQRRREVSTIGIENGRVVLRLDPREAEELGYILMGEKSWEKDGRLLFAHAADVLAGES